MDGPPVAPAHQVVELALRRSYPEWLDENGANVEQLARIGVDALQAAGLLEAAPAVSPRTSSRAASTRGVRRRSLRRPR